jgi:hypothetical protein
VAAPRHSPQAHKTPSKAIPAPTITTGTAVSGAIPVALVVVPEAAEAAEDPATDTVALPGLVWDAEAITIETVADPEDVVVLVALVTFVSILGLVWDAEASADETLVSVLRTWEDKAEDVADSVPDASAVMLDKAEASKVVIIVSGSREETILPDVD